MVERFLFNRVDAEARAFAVSREDHLPADILADEAKTAVALFKLAGARAEIALNPVAAVYLVPPSSWVIADIISRDSWRWLPAGSLRIIASCQISVPGAGRGSVRLLVLFAFVWLDLPVAGG